MGLGDRDVNRNTLVLLDSDLPGDVQEDLLGLRDQDILMLFVDHYDHKHDVSPKPSATVLTHSQ